MCLPSVEGDAEASLASSILMATLAAVAIFCFHSTLPAVDAHTRTRSLFSPEVMKMRSPQMIGVDEPLPGNGSVQTMFFLSLQEVGNFFSLEMPSLCGPRQLGQFSARAMELTETI